jgi:hypothetical protein
LARSVLLPFWSSRPVSGADILLPTEISTCPLVFGFSFVRLARVVAIIVRLRNCERKVHNVRSFDGTREVPNDGDREAAR